MIYYPITKEAQGINVYCKHRSKECIPAMLAQGDDTQRSQGEHSKYIQVTDHEESAEREISILTIPPSRIRMGKQEAKRDQVAGNALVLNSNFLQGNVLISADNC